jgi:nucleoid DNA-binding protein
VQTSSPNSAPTECYKLHPSQEETQQGYGSIEDSRDIGNAKHVLMQKQVNSNRMTKQQLSDRVAAKAELGKAEAAVAVDSVLDLIAEALRSNDRVDLRGFGSFVVKERKERQGRNPRTGESITIAAKRVASFRPGKELTEKLAQGETAPTPEEAP